MVEATGPIAYYEELKARGDVEQNRDWKISGVDFGRDRIRRAIGYQSFDDLWNFRPKARSGKSNGSLT